LLRLETRRGFENPGQNGEFNLSVGERKRKMTGYSLRCGFRHGLSFPSGADETVPRHIDAHRGQHQQHSDPEPPIVMNGPLPRSLIVVMFMTRMRMLVRHAKSIPDGGAVKVRLLANQHNVSTMSLQ
jgi:hypothetical protein